MKSWRSLTMAQARRQQLNGAAGRAAMDGALRAAAIRENPVLGAYTHLLTDQALAEAAEHPLSGFSAAIKANIAICGAPNHCGSRLLEDYLSPYDSTAIARLRLAGSRCLGVTTMDEFGMGSSCENTSLGRVLNPWSEERVAGGSSGGSAAAVAAGLAWYGLGSDTGGSVRLPAHFCGVVGLKPTWGRISRFGLVAFASSLDTIGILARGSEDAFEVFQALQGYDPGDATTLEVEESSAPLATLADLKGLKIGFLENVADFNCQDDVLDDYRNSRQMMTDLGARVQPVALEDLAHWVSVYTVLNCAEAASNLHRYDGSLYGSRVSGEDYPSSLVATRRRGFGTEVKRRLLLGAHVLSSGYRDRYYLRARQARQEMGEFFQSLFADYDLIALPTSPTSAVKRNRWHQDPVGMLNHDVFTIPASLAGLPAVSLPTGLDSRGLPLSLQLMGPSCSERRLLEVTRVLEGILDFRSRKEAPWNRES